RNAPRLSRARDAEVLEAACDERTRLVEPETWQDEVWLRVVEREQLVLVGGETEEGVLLFDPLGLRLVDRAQPVGRQLVFGLERLAADAVEARVDVLIDVAVVVDPLQEVP